MPTHQNLANNYNTLLPIQAVSADICHKLVTLNLLLVAPPGAGKSTFLPLQLLKHSHFAGQKIIMLQPRRLAARSIAGYLARQLGESLGNTIGYRIRGEHKVSAHTRLEIVTEGVLTRMLQSDPELSGVGLVIFDEFHERNLHGDFSLALCIEVQQALREDLRILVMSATLDPLPLLELLPNNELIESQGRSYPISYHYQGFNRQLGLASQCAGLVKQALLETDGSMLVFLPGAGEIKQVQALLQESLPAAIRFYLLYGDLTKDEQQAAIAPAAQGERKIVLATNIAETSLTIEGISTVVDSGFEKVARFHLSKGIMQLSLKPISQASAIQRAGRAGRLQAGHCYRLWAQEQQQRLAKQSTPQILQADIAPLMLESYLWGSDIRQLPLLDHPSQAQIDAGKQLLLQLDAIDTQGKLTANGKAMAQLGCHPRLASLLLRAKQWGEAAQYLACQLVALLEQPPVGKQPKQVSKCLLKLTSQQIKLANNWARRLQLKPQVVNESTVSLTPILLALAYPDHIGKQRDQGRFLLANGSGAQLDVEQALAQSPYLAVAQMLLTHQADARISLAEPLDSAKLQEGLPGLFRQYTQCQWQQQEERIQALQLTKLGAITVHQQPLSKPDQAQLHHIWCEQIRKRGLQWLDWGDDALQLQHKLHLAHQFLPHMDWPDLSASYLLHSLQDWLVPYLGNISKHAELTRLNVKQLLWQQLDWQQQQVLEQHFPSRLVVPSGNSHRLDYTADGSVTLAVRMQEVYGLQQSPSLANGKLPVTLSLLSPACRPLQTTQDLAGFWAGAYKEVQKEMKGRYPKHFWPDDPATAVATDKTKKRM